MEMRSVLPLPAATADVVTLTLVGTFDPRATLQDRLKKLRPRPPRTRVRGGEDWDSAMRWWARETTRLERYAKQYSLSGGHAGMAEALSSAVAILEAQGVGFREDEQPSVAEFLLGLAAELKGLSVTCALQAPTVSDGGALMAALHGTLDLAVPTGEGSSGLEDGGRSPLWRFSYGSPWVVEAGVVLSGGSASLAALIYGIRALCGIDLEIRLRRTELRERLEEAEARARRLRELDVDERREWGGKSAVAPTPSDIEEHTSINSRIGRVSFFPWRAERAVLSDHER